VITLAVQWYLRFGLSYRDVEELLAERGITVYPWANPQRRAAQPSHKLLAKLWHCLQIDTPYDETSA